MSPEAKLDAILEKLAGIMGRLDTLDDTVLTIAEQLQAEWLDEVKPEGSA